MANRNFPTISQMTRGHNYVLTQGRPYGWTNGDRMIAVSRALNGEPISQVAKAVGCCKRSVKNWVKTFDKNNPRLEG